MMLTVALIMTGIGFFSGFLGCLLMAHGEGKLSRGVVASGVALIFAGMVLAFVGRF